MLAHDQCSHPDICLLFDSRVCGSKIAAPTRQTTRENLLAPQCLLKRRSAGPASSVISHWRSCRYPLLSPEVTLVAAAASSLANRFADLICLFLAPQIGYH